MRGAVCVGAVVLLLTAGPALGQSKKPDVVARLEGHRGGVASVAYSAKGDRIATGSGNGVVRVWDAKTGELLLRVDDGKHNSARVNHVAFSADGRYLSSSSRTVACVWDLSDPKRVTLRYEDPYAAEAGKLGAVSGDGKLVYFSGVESGGTVLSTYSLVTRAVTKIDLPAKLRPTALASIPDVESALVALYCVTGEKGEAAAVALVGLGETRVLAREVPPPVAGKAVSIGFSPDAKWFLVGNGSKVACWRVPGSQVITGDPKSLPGTGHFVAAAGPRNLVVAASTPNGKPVTVSLFDLGGGEPKRLADYVSGLERVSAMAFAPDGSILAVADDAEGVLQLWALK